MPRAVLLKGEALQLAREIEVKRAELQAALEREANMHQARVKAHCDAWQAYMRPMLAQLAATEGYDPDLAGVDNTFFPMTGCLFLVEVDQPEGRTIIPGEQPAVGDEDVAVDTDSMH